MVGIMTYESPGQGGLDYLNCRYGASKLQFRGPRKKLEGDYVAFLGGTETYGKFIESPFPALVEAETGLNCVNFGWINAGADVYLNDTGVLEACSGARLTVIQVMGAQNMSNRFYAVHPRRNDRFLNTSNLMRRVFHDIDFTQYNFTRHLLQDLHGMSRERYNMLVDELQEAWVGRMSMLLKRIEGRTLLLWFADHCPDDPGIRDRVASDPLFVTREMIDELAPLATEYVEVVPDGAVLAKGTEGMVYGPLEAQAAEMQMGPAAHDLVASALAGPIMRLVGARRH